MSPFLAIASIALGLIGLSSFRFGAAGIERAAQSFKTYRQRHNRLASFRQDAEIARLQSELQSKPTAGWRVMEVAEIVQESEDCRSFYLVDPYGETLPEFRPGQYLMLRPAMAGAFQTTRCYSLSSSPNSRYWRVTVKRQEGIPRDAFRSANGGLSQWLHTMIQAGDCLLVGGPSGQFFLPEENRNPLVLLAAGVGITPMASMLRWSLEHTPDRDVVVVYQVKDLEHWPLGESLHSWRSKFPNVSVHTFCSRATQKEMEQVASELPGRFEVGKFDFETVLKLSPQDTCDYFMCGPDPWMNSIRDGLLNHGVADENVHWESFGGTGKQPEGVTHAGDIDAVEVRFEHSDTTAQWTDPEQTLWELARENGIEIPSGCLSGVCGCCRVDLQEGEVEYDRDITLELSNGQCLTCVARPKCNVVIDA